MGTDRVLPKKYGSNAVRADQPSETSESGQQETRGYFRKNSLDEMTVGRTEKPVSGKLPPKPDFNADKKTTPKTRHSPLLEGQPVRGTGTPASGSPLKGGAENNRASAERGEKLKSGADSNGAVSIKRGKIGAGSYEDEGEARRKRRPGKTGRPGR